MRFDIHQMETEGGQAIGQTPMGKNLDVSGIIEIFSVTVGEVGLNHDESSADDQDPFDFIKSFEKVFTAQMLKHIARKDGIKGIIPIVLQGGTRPDGDLHILSRIFSDLRKKVEGMLLQALDVIDEMAVTGTDFKDLGLRADVAPLQETANFLPDPVPSAIVNK